MNDSSYSSLTENEISYGIFILSKAASRQCVEPMNNTMITKLAKQNTVEKKSLEKKTNSSSPLKLLRSNVNVSSHKTNANKLRKTTKHFSVIHKQSNESKFQSRIDREIFILSKRFNVSRLS